MKGEVFAYVGLPQNLTDLKDLHETFRKRSILFSKDPLLLQQHDPLLYPATQPVRIRAGTVFVQQMLTPHSNTPPPEHLVVKCCAK